VSAPRFLIDECLPVDVTLAFRARGLDVVDIVERGVRGLCDEEVWTLAIAEGRILVTRDLDFPLRTSEQRPPGLVLIRAPKDATAPELGALVSALIDGISASSLVGCITVVSPRRYRQRFW
jgi:predicted nuclease of predicted toxin-antitoxin system